MSEHDESIEAAKAINESMQRNAQILFASKEWVGAGTSSERQVMIRDMMEATANNLGTFMIVRKVTRSFTVNGEGYTSDE